MNFAPCEGSVTGISPNGNANSGNTDSKGDHTDYTDKPDRVGYAPIVLK